MTDVRTDSLDDEELVERARVYSASNLTQALADRLEAKIEALEAYEKIGEVAHIVAALELARTAALRLTTYSSSECSVVNQQVGEQIEAALASLKF